MASRRWRGGDCPASCGGAVKRSGPLKRSTGINPVNRKRKAANHKRAYGGQAFLNYIHRLPCWACGYAGPSPRQAAHTINGGMGRKGDADTIIALCNVCHSKQHAQGWLAIGMTAESRTRAAAQTWASWEARLEASDCEVDTP